MAFVTTLMAGLRMPVPSVEVPVEAAAAGEGTGEGAVSAVGGPEMVVSGAGVDGVVGVCDEGDKMELTSRVRPLTGSHKIPVQSLDELAAEAGALTGMGLLAVGGGAL